MNNESVKFQDKILCIGFSLFILLDIFLPQYGVLWLGGLLMLEVFYLLFFFRTIKIRINLISSLFYLFLIISVFGILVPDLRSSNIRADSVFTHVITLFIAFLAFAILSSASNWQNYMIKSLTLVCGFFLIGTVWQMVSPKTLLSFNRLTSTTEHYNSSYDFVRRGLLSGFTYNTGLNGFVLSILLILLYIKLFENHSKIKKTILLLASGFVGYLLILTSKRGFLLFTLAILIYLTIRLSDNKKQIIVLGSLVAIACLVLIMFSEGGQAMIARSLKQADITSGRAPVYAKMWDDFLQYPVLGNGTYTTNSVIHLFNGHNIYLQVLRENGIIGFFIFFLLLFFSLIKTDKKIRNSIDRKEQLIASISSGLQLLFVLWGITGNPLYDVYPLVAYIIGLSMYTSLESENKEKHRNYELRKVLDYEKL